MMKVGQAYAFLFLDENENLINYLTSEKNYMTLFSNSFSIHARANALEPLCLGHWAHFIYIQDSSRTRREHWNVKAIRSNCMTCFGYFLTVFVIGSIYNS